MNGLTAKADSVTACRKIGRIIAVLLFCTSLLHGAEKPNIVWLVSEDNSADWLRLYNKNGAPMPNVETLAKSGIVFNNAFSCAPVCSVARSTIISGCYAPRLGVQYHRQQVAVPMPKGLHMFPYYLRKAGYYTTNCNKEDYNFVNEAKLNVWDSSSGKATYRKRRPGQPFFHVQNFGITHENRLHFGDMADKTKTNPKSVTLFKYHPDTPTFRYTYAKYLDLQRTLDGQIGQFLAGLKREGLMDDTFIFYYGDHGGVLPRGKGYAYDSGLRVPMVVHIPKNWKHLAPAAVGTSIDGTVQFVDLSATVLNLAGVQIPNGIDGKPFLGKGVALDELNARDISFGYADRFDEKYDMVRTIRKGRYRYMRNYQPFNFDGLYNAYRYKMLAYREWQALFKAGKLNAEQSQFFLPRPVECLYDLEADPSEVKNLAADPVNRATLLELRGILQRQVKSMPDLSFYPENVFLAQGKRNPTGFGQKKKADIARLVDIADLSLLPFLEAQPKLSKALKSNNPWERYWGLIVCSCFGKQAEPFYQMAETMAASDKENLVRVRAAEFLGLVGKADPRATIISALKQTEDLIEAGLILNSAVLLQDSKPGYKFDSPQIPGNASGNGLVALRLQYLKQ